MPGCRPSLKPLGYSTKNIRTQFQKIYGGRSDSPGKCRVADLPQATWVQHQKHREHNFSKDYLRCRIHHAGLQTFPKPLGYSTKNIRTQFQKDYLQKPARQMPGCRPSFKPRLPGRKAGVVQHQF